MSALVSLHRDTSGLSGAHVLALPPWLPPVRSRTGVTGTYWHQPRSATLRPDGRLTVVLWCGPYRTVDTVDAFRFDPPEEDLRCGTCLGRRLGYDREQGAIFQPRNHFVLPRVCPSTTPDPANLRLCIACGRPTNCARGWYASGLARHAPDPALEERHRPCPRHGWRDLHVEFEHATREETDRLVCSVWSCGYVSPRR